MSEGERRANAVHAAAYKDSTERPPEALENLFREHHGSVFRAAYRITGDASDAEDVLQTTTLAVMVSADQMPGVRAFLPWARDGMLAGTLGSALFLGKGSLFLGRMTNLADGASLLIEGRGTT